MNDLLIVAKFTIKDMIRRKSFIISTLIILFLIMIGFNIPNILEAFDKDEGKKDKILLIDENNVYEDTLNNLNLSEEYTFIIENKHIDFESIKNKIANEEIDNAIVINEVEGKLNIDYYVENKSMFDYVPEDISAILTNAYINLQISKVGLTEEQLLALNPEINFEIKQTDDTEVKGNQFAIMLISIVLFYSIYFCAFQVSSSITTEKTSKIIETLVTSTKPKAIVLGKTIGIGIVGLIQLIAIVATALISNALFLKNGMLDSIIDFNNITPFLGIITIIYFILGYATYAMLYALTGSTVSKPEDVQSANGPVSIIAVVGFYLAYFTMMNPTSNLNLVASIVPISSPFCMPFRVMMGVASPLEIIISILVLILTIALIAYISIKIYSQAILNYGSKISIKDLIAMYKNKNI